MILDILFKFLDARYNDLRLFPLQKKTLFNQLNNTKWLRKLNLSVPSTWIKVENSAALKEKISWLI